MLDIKEVALVNVTLSDKVQQLLLIRSGNRKIETGGYRPGFARSLFGGIFTAGDEDSCAVAGEWLAIGNAESVKEYSERLAAEGSLHERLSGNGLSDRLPQKECGFWA